MQNVRQGVTADPRIPHTVRARTREVASLGFATSTRARARRLSPKWWERRKGPHRARSCELLALVRARRRSRPIAGNDSEPKATSNTVRRRTDRAKTHPELQFAQ